MLLVAVYAAAMVAANLLVWLLGPWFSPVNAFLLVGLDLTLRDVMQERLPRWQLFGAVALGGVLTFALNPAALRIALASAAAFTASALADWLAYSLLHRRSWLERANGSNIAGAVVDSALFPTLAFGAFLPGVIALQIAAKIGGGALWSIALRPLLEPRVTR